jgi:hypothetical protein
MEVTIEDVLKDKELLEKVLKTYNAHKKSAVDYYEKNREVRNEHSKQYYYKKIGRDLNKEPKEKKTADIKQYMKEYRQKRKDKKNI